MSELINLSRNIDDIWASNARIWRAKQDLSRPVLSNRAASTLPFQRWFRFKEAFAPEFVASVIEELPYKPQHIVDPFAGSGTTAITSRVLGIRSTSIELNPLMADIVRAKITKISATKFRESVLRILSDLNPEGKDFVKPTLMPPTFVEPGVNNRYIFPLDVFAISRAILRKSSFLDRDEARLVRVALASCLVRNSNVRVNGKGRRYRSRWNERQPTVRGLLEDFEEACEHICEDLLDFTLLPRGCHTLLQGDARQKLIEIESADAIICSPPYPNSFDYTDVYNVELWMLDYLCSSDDNRSLRSATIRSHVQYRWPDRPGLVETLGSSTLNRTIAQIIERRNDLWDPYIPEMIVHYFDDMRKIFLSAKRILQKGNYIVFAVGNSRYAHITIEVPEILMELVAPLGFSSVKKEAVRSMRTSAQHGGREDLEETAISFVYNGG